MADDSVMFDYIKVLLDEDGDSVEPQTESEPAMAAATCGESLTESVTCVDRKVYRRSYLPPPQTVHPNNDANVGAHDNQDVDIKQPDIDILLTAPASKPQLVDDYHPLAGMPGFAGQASAGECKVLTLSLVGIKLAIDFDKVIQLLDLPNNIEWPAECGLVTLANAIQCIHLGFTIIPHQYTRLRSNLPQPQKAVVVGGGHWCFGCDSIDGVEFVTEDDVLWCRDTCHYLFLSGVQERQATVLLDTDAIIRLYAGDGGNPLA